MAITEVFVDPAIAADSGRGTRATVTLTAATFNLGALTLNETNAFTAYNTLGFAAGDRIWLTGGTAVTVGFHAIASITSNSEIVMVADITTDASSPTDVTSDSAPYGDLEYAIEQTTFDTTNGTRVNVKAGTDEILAVELGAAFDSASPTAAWATSPTAIAVVQGYTATAGDGGKGGISGGGSVNIIVSFTIDQLSFVDMHLHNGADSGFMCVIDNFCSFINCELNDQAASGAAGGIDGDSGTMVFGCYVHDIGSRGINTAANSFISFNYLVDETNKFTNQAIICNGSQETITNNIIWLNGTTSSGIKVNGTRSVCSNNSIFNNTAGTVNGILTQGSNVYNYDFRNNIVEGFSGAGGTGFALAGTNNQINVYGGNASFNNTTHYSAPAGHVIMNLGDNETLSVSGFTDGPNKDFSPVNTGNVKEGALPASFGDQ